MPKLKTNKAAAKRFRRTKSGKFKRNKAFARHIMTKKSSKRKRNLRKSTIMDPAEAGRLKRLLPNG